MRTSIHAICSSLDMSLFARRTWCRTPTIRTLVVIRVQRIKNGAKAMRERSLADLIYAKVDSRCLTLPPLMGRLKEEMPRGIMKTQDNNGRDWSSSGQQLPVCPCALVTQILQIARYLSDVFGQIRLSVLLSYPNFKKLFKTRQKRTYEVWRWLFFPALGL